MANNLKEEIMELMQPIAALIAYRSEEGSYFLELREINEKGRMGEGVPVTYDFMNTIISNHTETHNGIPHGKMPPNLLYCDTRKGSEKYVWYDPPGKRMMFFKSDLGIENGEYNLPGIIYVVENDCFLIYAYKGKDIQPSTPLCIGPFFNVSSTNVCLGNAKLDKPVNPTFTEYLQYWEKKFWLTEFSHLGRDGNPTKNNLVLVTKACKEAPFDEKELKTLTKTLKDILR